MGWRDLLQKDETVTLPWLGGRSLRLGPRVWQLVGRVQPEVGWYEFLLRGRRASMRGAAPANHDVLKNVVKGYLVGDRLVPEDAPAMEDMNALTRRTLRVNLIEPGLDRFVRVSAGQWFEEGPLVFRQLEMPLGPEPEVLGAYLDEAKSLEGIKNVSPALELSFRFESWRRDEAEKQRKAEQERREKEERQRRIVEQLGDGAGRREVAKLDFGQAARAALAVGGAVYLDSRLSVQKGEMVVRFRLNGRRHACTCNAETLRIIDSGICLTDHDTEEQGDSYFTLESLPAVILQADREDKLVIYRHED